MFDSLTLKELVFQNLDQAVANGDDFFGCSVYDVTCDLHAYFTDMGEPCEEDDIRLYVCLWMMRGIRPVNQRVNWSVEGF